jgi:hypothetical protein
MGKYQNFWDKKPIAMSQYLSTMAGCQNWVCRYTKGNKRLHLWQKVFGGLPKASNYSKIKFTKGLSGRNMKIAWRMAELTPQFQIGLTYLDHTKGNKRPHLLQKVFGDSPNASNYQFKRNTEQSRTLLYKLYTDFALTLLT